MDNKPIYSVNKNYGSNKKSYIKLLYILGIILWIALIMSFGLFQKQPLVLCVLSIPFFIFIFNYYNVNNITTGMEDILYKVNYLSIALVVVVPLITWFNNNGLKEMHAITRKKFMSIIITALIFTLLSLLDIWVNEKYISVLKHIKSILQTISLTLIIYALYSYYIETIE